jgi:hypothetical protein
MKRENIENHQLFDIILDDDGNMYVCRHVDQEEVKFIPVDARRKTIILNKNEKLPDGYKYL